MELLVLGEADVRGLLEPEALLEGLAAGFRALSEGRVVAPARNQLTVPDAGFVLAMPAWQPGGNIAIKLVSVFHDNHRLGLPAHQAVISLLDAGTGTPVALVAGTSITAFRTAGAAALSVRLLAREDAAVLAIVGAGVQGATHLQLVPRVRPVREVRVASLDRADAERVAAADPRARVVGSAEEAVRGADIVCLCTSSDRPAIELAWLAPGAHVTSVGYRPPGGELPRAVAEAGRLFVETRLAFAPPPAGCAELGGLDPAAGTELGEVLLGRRPGRQGAAELTVYKSMGHAVEDLVAANLVLERARGREVGVRVRL